MRRFILICFYFILVSLRSLFGQEIKFFEQEAVVDGVLDSHLRMLEEYSFNYIWQFNNPVTDTVKVTWRMGYTPRYLYLYMEAQAEKIVYRTRGYSNGDGLRLLLGRNSDTETEEFYDLAFSPRENDKSEKYILEYNVGQKAKYLSNKTAFKAHNTNGKSGFELFLAWEDIKPYHPWLKMEMGYNLYFAKGLADTITNGYAMVHDEGIWDEGVKRKVAPISFKKPEFVSQNYTLVTPLHRNSNTFPPLKIVTLSAASFQTKLHFMVFYGTEKVWSEEHKIGLGTGLTHRTIQLRKRDFKPGVYTLKVVEDGKSISTDKITLFPDINYNFLRKHLKLNRFNLKDGTIATLQFKINQIEEKRNKLKPYENGSELYGYWENFQREWDLFVHGEEPYKNLRKPYRRAFKSKQDGRYQPYTIRLPENYNPLKKYPLLVFLHGSGQDEQRLLDKQRGNGAFIELAPFGRDKYLAYTKDESQKDIVEAIEDVKKHFSIDEENIIIGGFSMGGYGALLSFYNHPKIYKSVAVFAGHPDLAREWLGVPHPNFLDPNYLKAFKNVPVFIYHGEQDGAIPVHFAQKTINALKKAGAQLTFSIVKGHGHQYQDSKTHQIYGKWLNKVIGQ